MSPAISLATAVALFATPAIYLLLASLMSHHGTLGGTAIPGSAAITFWCVGIAALIIPFFSTRLMRPSPDSTRLLIALVATAAAPILGLTLTLTTGELLSLGIFAPASMIATLGWSWGYRRCFRATPLDRVVSRYTKVLVAVAVFAFAWAGLELALWEHTVDPEVGPGPDGFTVFVFASFGAAAVAVARLRRSASEYAGPATQVLSGALLFIFPLGSIAALYWFFRVRHLELPSTHAA